MRVALDHLDLRGLTIDLPMGEPPSERRVAEVREAEGLRGLLLGAEGRTSLSGLEAGAVRLDALHLDFGSVVLDASEPDPRPAGRAPAEFEGLRGRFNQAEGELVLELEARHVHATSLVVDVLGPGVRVSGRVAIAGMRLAVDDGDGRVEGAEVEIEDFRLEWGDVRVESGRAFAKALTIGWGEGFVLEAEGIAAPSLELAMGATSFALEGARVEGLGLHDGDLDLRAAGAEKVSVQMSFEGPEPSEESPSEEGDADAGPARDLIVDLQVLDGLSGVLALDLEVDLSVPIIGSRRATHRFRIPIDRGSIDFIALENDLSTLESALLDFALRGDGTLVLELGLPLLPTRGLGKPIVAWDLGPEDRALARSNRIRLAKLPDVRLAGDPSRERTSGTRGGGDEGGFALRKLGFRSIDASLRLARPAGSVNGVFQGAEIDGVTFKGELYHEPSAAPRAGSIRAGFHGLSLEVRPMALGEQRLSIGGVCVRGESEITARFAGVRPEGIRGVLGDVSLEGLSLRGE